jgi:hypothetical protein
MRFPRSVRYILAAIVTLAGLALACRILVGPLDRPIPIHSPLNAESLFATAGLLLVLFRARRSGGTDRERTPEGWDPVAAVAITVTTIAAFAWTARVYFLSDDFLLLGHARAPFPGWWRLLSTPGGDGFFRPVGYISYFLSSKWAASNTDAWHWIGILMHTADSILVYVLVAVIGHSRFTAWLAATLFALHGAHPEAVVWLAGRFDLLATLLFLLGMIAFVRSVDASPQRCFLYQAIALMLMVGALLTKESAYAFPLIAVLFLACHADASRRLRLAVPIVVVTASMFVYRWTLFGGIGGYRGQDGRPEAMSLDAISAIKALVLRLWAILFFPIDWSVAPGMVLGAISIIYLIALAVLFSARAEFRRLIFAAAFTVLAALPAVPQLLIGADLQKSRVVYLPSIGFCLLLAILLTRFPTKLRWALASAVILFQGAALGHNLATWRKASDAVQSACAAVAACPVKPDQKILVTGLPHSINGVYAFANGFPECVAMQSSTMVGQAIQIQIDTQIGNHDEYACRFHWDSNAGMLRREPAHP